MGKGSHGKLPWIRLQPRRAAINSELRSGCLKLKAFISLIILPDNRLFTEIEAKTYTRLAIILLHVGVTTDAVLISNWIH
jgi:hypothetical protein